MTKQLISEIKHLTGNSSILPNAETILTTNPGSAAMEVIKIVGSAQDALIADGNKLIAAGLSAMKKAGYPVTYYKDSSNALVIAWIQTTKGRIVFFKDEEKLELVASFSSWPQYPRLPSFLRAIVKYFDK